MSVKQAGLLVVLVLGSVTAAAQDVTGEEAADDELMPAVSSAELAQMGNEDDSEEDAELLAEDVTRTTVSNGVMDELDLGRTEITGNQELPKVLYIVPWQKSGPAELTGKPVNTLLGEVLAPVDRSEFVRQVDYYDDLYRDDGN